MTNHICVVEDEIDLAETIQMSLEQSGFETSIVHNLAEAKRRFDSDPVPDIVLLDLMLPGGSGIDLCRQLRAKERFANTGIVIMTAKGDEIDRVVGFEVGADDYVVKPFSVRELLLRVKAVLRRLNQAQLGNGPGDITTFGLLRVDPESHRVWVEDVEVVLTALEFRLLQTFMSRRGRVQTRDTLLRDVWGITANVTTRTVDTHVKRLREKLSAAADYVETVRGVGYRFRTSHEEPNA